MPIDSNLITVEDTEKGQVTMEMCGIEAILSPDEAMLVAAALIQHAGFARNGGAPRGL